VRAKNSPHRNLPLFLGNSAKKLVGGAVMMVPERLLAFVDEVK
jgi:hypothetical protein